MPVEKTWIPPKHVHTWMPRVSSESVELLQLTFDSLSSKYVKIPPRMISWTNQYQVATGTHVLTGSQVQVIFLMIHEGYQSALAESLLELLGVEAESRHQLEWIDATWRSFSFFTCCTIFAAWVLSTSGGYYSIPVRTHPALFHLGRYMASSISSSKFRPHRSDHVIVHLCFLARRHII